VRPNGHSESAAREDALNRVLADFLDALGRGDRVNLLAWQARYPSFASDLADLLAARREVGETLEETRPGGGQSIGTPGSTTLIGTLGDYDSTVGNGDPPIAPFGNRDPPIAPP
jgi:hypothetical protein